MKKIFIGARVTADLAFQLQEFVLEDLKLKKIQNNDKEYIGSYFESTSYVEMKKFSEELARKLSLLFPDRLFDPTAFAVISQTFIY